MAIKYTWTILDLFAENDAISSVRYNLKADDGKNIVETEGTHIFADGTVQKSYSETVEKDVINWLVKDTTQDDVNIIKLNLESQLKAIKPSNKVNPPWEAGTFTIG